MPELDKFEVPELDKGKWDKRKGEDSFNFINEIKSFLEVDGRGISGENLFPLSLDLSNSLLTLRSIKLRDGSDVDKGIFQALCPELECFVSFVNWLGSEESRSEKHIQYQRKIKEFINSECKETECKISGNYRLALNDYAKILPFRGDLSFENNESSLFNWENAPFIKRTEETFFANSSPIFMSIINKIGEGSSEARLFCFSAPFIIKNINNENLTIDLIYGTRPHCRKTDVKNLLDLPKMNLLKSNKRIFLGLFADVIQNYKREIYLIDLSGEEDIGNLLVSHLLITRLYYTYLINKGQILICSENNLRKRIEIIARQTAETYNLSIKISSYKDFYNKYLANFFHIHQGQLYYLPHVLRSLLGENVNEFIEFYSKLNTKIDLEIIGTIELKIKSLEQEIEKDTKLFGTLKFISEAMINAKKEELKRLKDIRELDKFKKEIFALNFINIFNKYSKRTLIKIISSEKAYDARREWRWAI